MAKLIITGLVCFFAGCTFGAFILALLVAGVDDDSETNALDALNADDTAS